MKKLIALFSVILLAGASYAKEVTLLMDWFPQGNQSGYWQAQFDNEYHDDVKIVVKSGVLKSIQPHKWRLVQLSLGYKHQIV